MTTNQSEYIESRSPGPKKKLAKCIATLPPMATQHNTAPSIAPKKQFPPPVTRVNKMPEPSVIIGPHKAGKIPPKMLQPENAPGHYMQPNFAFEESTKSKRSSAAVAPTGTPCYVDFAGGGEPSKLTAQQRQLALVKQKNITLPLHQPVETTRQVQHSVQKKNGHTKKHTIIAPKHYEALSLPGGSNRTAKQQDNDESASESPKRKNKKLNKDGNSDASDGQSSSKRHKNKYKGRRCCPRLFAIVLIILFLTIAPALIFAACYYAIMVSVVNTTTTDFISAFQTPLFLLNATESVMTTMQYET